MVGKDPDTNNSPSQNNNIHSYAEYLTRAADAHDAGDRVLSLHLYLAAYERAMQDSRVPDPPVIEGLRQAWSLACESKERSLAEYIFEKLEPYLSAEEVAQSAGKLQRLALDKLEEFGLSREDLEDMTDMISQDFFGIDPSTLLMRFEQGLPAQAAYGAFQRGLVRDAEKIESSHIPDDVSPDVSPEAAPTAEVVASAQNTDTLVGGKESDTITSSDEPEDDSEASSLDASKLSQEVASGAAPATPGSGGLGGLMALDGTQGLFALADSESSDAQKSGDTAEKLTYRDLVGFENAVKTMNDYGVGMSHDPDFKKLVDSLNHHHGLNRVPITDSFLFRSPVREDANQFMIATMGEMGLPAIRMRMEENLQGLPVLCVMASSDNQPRLNAARNAIEGGGVLILEDIDMWSAPLSDASSDEFGSFVYAQLSRGAREAMNLIRSAVENPDVYVLMSAAKGADIDPFFFDFLDPLTVVDIEYPTVSERSDLWANIAKEHPSLRGVDREMLVGYSSGLSRFDIYMAAREAVEEAYKASLVAKRYQPVAPKDILEKLAAYQPLESQEYQRLENAVVELFRTEIDKLDDVLKGTSE